LKNSFESLGLSEPIVKAIEVLGYENPTPIQEKAIPVLLDSDSDLIAFAQTGTGKTAAFSLPILNKVDVKDKQVQALILSPTRELGLQIAEDIKHYSQFQKGVKIAAVYGGANIVTQIKQLEKGVQIVVGTPGRTLDLIKRKKLKVEHIQYLVMDEADEMLSMGFSEDLDEILSHTPDEKQIMMFSATLPPEAVKLSKKYMKNPVEVSAGSKKETNTDVTHGYFMVRARDRYEALKRIVDVNPDIYGIIFCRTRRETQEISDRLIGDGYQTDAIHGDLSQAQRDHVMGRFRNKTLQLLVATDVAARGIDVDVLTHVINYNLPDEAEVYVHRSGRTGRAGNKGHSFSIINTRELNRIKPLKRLVGKEIKPLLVPDGDEICQQRLFQMMDKVKNVDVDESQIEQFLPQIYEQFEGLTREELIQRFVSIEFNRFLSYYKGSKNINASSEGGGSDSGRDRRRSRDDDGKFQRFFINKGNKDRLTAKKLLGFINDTVGDSSMDVGRIDIMDSYSFFEVDINFADTILSELNGQTLGEKSVSIEKAEPSTKKGRGGGGRNRGKGGSRDRSGSRKPRGEGRRGSSSNNPDKGKRRRRRFGN
jgi:ATP-dependent RNA helicase DeaD